MRRSLFERAIPWRAQLGFLFWFFLPGPLFLYAAEKADAGAKTGQSLGIVGNTLWETLARGGSLMYVILGASVLGVTFIFESLLQSRRGALLPSAMARRLRDPADATAVEELVADSGKTAIQQILRAGWRWRHGTMEQVQAAIEEKVDELIWRYRRVARPVGILANVAPLLGLLGTVIGIIQAFDAVAREGALGDPTVLAGGISKALLTTGFGLIVAIPLLLSYHYLTGLVEARLRECEELAKERLIQPPAEERKDSPKTDADSGGPAK